MVHQTKDILQAVLGKFDGWLYNEALTKFVYLMDLEAVKVYEEQITDINWFRNYSGPFTRDILDCVSANRTIFYVITDGQTKIGLNIHTVLTIDSDVQMIIDKVANETPDPKGNYGAFKQYVYSTDPMVVSKSMGPLNIKRVVEASKNVDEVADVLLNTPEWDEAFEYLATH